MKTITFYSYKGGTGRSLALANAAQYLALSGFKVVALDLDLEAPGLHYKFSVNTDGRPLPVQAGVIDYLNSFIVERRIPDSIKDFTLDISFPGVKKPLVQLIPAGEAPSIEYWMKLSRINWHDLFYSKNAKGVQVFLELKNRISDKLNPDYLLIDSRTGITEISGVATALLADRVICLVLQTPENLEGARTVLRSLKRTRREFETKDLELLIVVSRLPQMPIEYEQELLDGIRLFLNEEAEDLKDTLSCSEVFVLHSEQALQIRESLRVGSGLSPKDSILLRDYMKLFPNVFIKEFIESRKPTWQAKEKIWTDSYQELSDYIKKAREIEKSFSLLQYEEVDDFTLFDENLEQLKMLSNKFIKTARETFSSFRKEQLSKLNKDALWLKELPFSLQKIIINNKERIKIPNPESINILLRELINCTNDISTLLKSFAEQKNILAGKPFKTAKTEEPLSNLFLKTAQSAVDSTDLRQYSILLDIIHNQRAQLGRFLEAGNGNKELQTSMLLKLWENFDLVLLEEYFNPTGEKYDLLKTILLNREDHNVQKVLFTLTLFSRDVTVKKVEKATRTKGYSEKDIRIILRCLTFHMYNEDIRQYAVANLDFKSLWTLLAFDHYPVTSLYEIEKNIFEKGDADYQKILFDLRYDDLANWLKDSASKRDDPHARKMSYITQFLLLFKKSPIMLEDTYHDRFVQVIKGVGLSSEDVNNTEFMELLEFIHKGKEDLLEGSPPDKDKVGSLPEVTRRKLTGNNLYFYYFITDSNNEVALLVLDSIKDSTMAAHVLRNRRINPALLSAIAKKTELMVNYETKKLLVFNPRAKVTFAGKYVYDLRPRDLKILSSSRDVDPGIKGLAIKELKSFSF